MKLEINQVITANSSTVTIKVDGVDLETVDLETVDKGGCHNCYFNKAEVEPCYYIGCYERTIYFREKSK